MTTGLFLYFTGYLAGIGKPACFGFGEHPFAIHNDIKNAPATGDKVRLRTESILQLLRQTGGSWFIVSLITVMNINLHIASPFNTMQVKVYTPAALCQ